MQPPVYVEFSACTPPRSTPHVKQGLIPMRLILGPEMENNQDEFSEPRNLSPHMYPGRAWQRWSEGAQLPGRAEINPKSSPSRSATSRFTASKQTQICRMTYTAHLFPCLLRRQPPIGSPSPQPDTSSLATYTATPANAPAAPASCTFRQHS